MNNIGLIIWGCKGGHRVFCSNGIVDYRQKAISDTIKDIRSFVRFNLINLTTYALEFTEDYKVFTIYRSCNDNGTGAYVAITIYVPHVQKVSNLRLLLDTMMDSYFKEFVHPVFGTYYDGKYDDIELFSNYINTLELVEEKELYKFTASVQDDKPHLKLFENISEVDTYFASPYRKEFFECQEVMFMSMDLYNRRPETLRFNFKEDKISGVSEPENLPQLYLGNDKSVKALKIGDNVVDVSKYHTINASTTTVTITLGREFCDDAYIVGNVSTLIQEKKLQEKKGYIILGSNLPLMTYKKYLVKFTLNGHTVPDQLLYVKEKGSPEASFIKIKNSTVEISGENLEKEYGVWVKPSPVNKKLLKVHTFIPSFNVKSGKAEDVEIKILQFTVSCSKKIADNYIYIYLPQIDSIIFAVPQKINETVKIFLPMEIDTTTPKFDVDSGGTEYDFDPDKKILYLSSKVLEYELNIPGIVKSAVQSWDFIIFGTSKKKSSSLFSGGNSFKIKLNSNDNISDGKLIINESQYRFQVTESQNPSITPLLLYVQLTKSQEGSVFEYTPYGKEHGTIKTTKDRIFPYVKDSEADILFDEREYVKSVTREKKPIIIIQLGKKGYIESASSSQTSTNVAQEEKDTKDIGRNSINSFVLTFENCAEFYTYGTSGDKIKLFDGKQLNMTSQSIDLYAKNEEKVLTIYKDKQIFTDELRKRYEDQGFSLEYTEDGCLIKYRKHKEVTKPWFKFKLLPKRFFTILSLSLICLLAIIGGWMYFWGNNPVIIAYGKFLPISTEYSEKIEKIELGNVNYLKIDKTINNSDTVFILSILPVSEGENYNNEDSAFVYFEGVKHPIVVKLFESNTTQPDITGVIKSHNRNSKEVDTVKIFVPTPVEIALERLTFEINNMPNQVKVDSLFGVCNNYAYKVKYSSLAVSKILQKAASYIKTKEDHSAYIKIFEEFNTYDEYNSVAESLEKLERKIKQAEEDSRKQLAWKQNANMQKTKLWSLDCSPTTVESVKTWYNAINSEDEKKAVDGVYNFKIAFQIYSSFFGAQNIDGVKPLLDYKSYFSKEQYIVIQGFCKDTNHFKELQRKPNNKLEFKKSYRIIQTWK